MRKIIFSINTTLDGFFEGPHHELDWSVADDELHDFFVTLLKSVDLILFGRVTYEMMLDYWPYAPSDPKATAGMKRFAHSLNPKRKIVYSKTMNQSGPNIEGWRNAEVVRTFDPQAIREMKGQPGGDILLDGASLAKAFIQNDLVDEFQLVVHPVAIGQGTRVFAGIEEAKNLHFQWIRQFNCGAVALCYETNRKPG